jgi:hypothetical protein
VSARALPGSADERPVGSGYPFHFEASIDVPASQCSVFDALDDHRRLAAHMESNSLMMAGARMAIQLNDRHGQAVGSRIGMAGRVLGMALRVDEVITTYERPWRKVWETIDEPRLLVIGRYRMGFGVEPLGTGSRVRIWIDYRLPAGGVARWLGAAAGRFYARWCTQQMLLGIRGA